MQAEFETGIRIAELGAGRWYMLERARVKVLHNLGALAEPSEADVQAFKNQFGFTGSDNALKALLDAYLDLPRSTDVMVTWSFRMADEGLYIKGRRVN